MENVEINANQESTNRTKIRIGLGLGIVFTFLIPIILALVFSWPEGTTSGTIYAITGGLVLIFMGIWMIAYRKTRPTHKEYFQQKNQSGEFQLFIGSLLVILIFFASYIILAAEGVADLTFAEFFTIHCHTKFGLTLTELWTQYGRQLSIMRFQIPIALISAGVAIFWGPKLKKQEVPVMQKKMIISIGTSILWIIIISIFASLGVGYVWVGTEGRFYLIHGLYDEQFSIYLITNLIFLFFGSVIYFRSRQYFWSDSVTEDKNNLGKWIILAGFIVFNLIFTISPLYPDLLITETSVSYLIFLLLNGFFSFGTILEIQSRIAEMGGSPNRQIRLISRTLWILFFLSIILYFGLYILLEVGISFQLSEIIALYPNLIFAIILTAGFYYVGIWLQTKIQEKEADK